MAFLQVAPGTGTTTASATLAGVTAGSTLIAFCWNGSSSTPTIKTCADAQGSYTAQGSAVVDSGNNIWQQCFTLENANAGSHAATFTSDSGASVDIFLVECTGNATGGVLGTNGSFQSSPGGGADILTSGSITIGVSATLIGMSSDTSNVGTIDEPTAGTGFTSQLNNFDTVIGSYRLESKSVSANAAATFGPGNVASTFVTRGIAIAEPTGGGTTPFISSTSTATPAYQSSLTITGTNFGASQGAGTVTIGAISQTVTAWADTSITVTVDRGTNKYGASVNIVVTDNTATSSAPYAISLTPQTGWAFVDVGTPNTIAANRLTSTPDLESGDQIAYTSLSGAVVVASDATFSVSTAVGAFQFEVWSVNAWGATATEVIIPSFFPAALNDAADAEFNRFRSLLDVGTWAAPLTVPKWFADELVAGANTSHSSTGALAAGSATLAGTAAHLTLHATTGALAASAATMAGTATHLTLHTTSGAIAAGSATVAGTAAHWHVATGALAAGSATVAGTAAHLTLHATSGALVAGSATIAGTATETPAAGASHATTGALSASAATVAGTAVHLTLHATSGALQAGAATIAGTAAHQHTTTGALSASAASVSGTAAHLTLHTSSGALTAQAASVAGAAAHVHVSTGALSAQAAAVSGTAVHTAAGTHDAIGALVAGAAQISSSADLLHTAQAYSGGFFKIPETQRERARLRKQVEEAHERVEEGMGASGPLPMPSDTPDQRRIRGKITRAMLIGEREPLDATSPNLEPLAARKRRERQRQEEETLLLL